MTTSRWGRKQFLLILNLDKKFYKLKWNDFVHFYSRQKEHHEPVLTMTRSWKFHQTNKQANKQTKLNYRKCNCENFWQAREGSGREKRWQLFSFEITLFKIFLSILPTFFCKANMLWHQVFKSYYSVLPKNYAKLYNSTQWGAFYLLIANFFTT